MLDFPRIWVFMCGPVLAGSQQFLSAVRNCVAVRCEDQIQGPGLPVIIRVHHDSCSCSRTGDPDSNVMQNSESEPDQGRIQ